MRISSCITPGESVSLDIEGIGFDFDLDSFREFVTHINALSRQVEDFESVIRRSQISHCPECGAKRRPDGIIEAALPEGLTIEIRVVRPEVVSDEH